MNPHDDYAKYFNPATAFQAEGARVGIATCKLCGAAVLIDPRDPANMLRKHYEWHRRPSVLEPCYAEGPQP